MNIRPSEQLDNAIFETMNNRVPCTYQIECFISSADANFEFEVQWFTGISIVQNFGESYSDAISVAIEVRPRDMLNILTNYKNLNGTITCTPTNVKTFKIYEDMDPIMFSGRVIIDNPQDIMKKYNVNQLIAQDEDKNTPIENHVAMRLPLNFQLMKQSTYDLRRKEVNAMFTNTTMDKVLAYVTDQFGIEKTMIKDVDNKDKIQNLVIPPGQDISSVFNFLQERYGVFGNGMRSYISDGKLSIYPGNDTEAKDYKTTMHVIKAPENYIPGDEGYHAEEDGEITIVSTAGGDIQNLTEQGVEQTGNSQISVQADRMIGFVSNVTEEGNVKLSENIQTLGLDTDRQAQDNAINSRYVGETTNSYNQLSNMGQFDCVIARANWIYAKPILMNPGQRVTFHYDNEDGVYSSASGVLESISYTSEKLPDRGLPIPFYGFGSELVMRLKPDKKSSE